MWYQSIREDEVYWHRGKNQRKNMLLKYAGLGSVSRYF